MLVSKCELSGLSWVVGWDGLTWQQCVGRFLCSAHIVGHPALHNALRPGNSG